MFPGDSRKRENKKLKAFEVMILASQVLGLGMIYSCKHHEDLMCNNFKYLRHDYDQLSEIRQEEIRVTLNNIGVELNKYDKSKYAVKMTGWKSIELEGTLEDTYNQIKTMLLLKKVPENTGRGLL